MRTPLKNGRPATIRLPRILLEALSNFTRGPRRTPRRTLVVAIAASLVAVAGGTAAAGAAVTGLLPGFGHARVGQDTRHGILLPSNQWIKPVGTRVLVSNGRLPSSTLSPDGTTLAALSWKSFTGYLSLID